MAANDKIELNMSDINQMKQSQLYHKIETENKTALDNDNNEIPSNYNDVVYQNGMLKNIFEIIKSYLTLSRVRTVSESV